jgi:predicted GNAT family N-acyltransferase
MSGITISHINSSSPKYRQVWDLREEILRKPLGMSLKNEDLSKDHTDTIFIAELNDEVIACLMLHRIDEETLQLRQMAVSDEWQGKGVGRLLVIAAEQYSKSEEFTKIILHARKVAVGFYKRLEYHISGEEFTEVGIPHFLMGKGL